MASEDWLVLAKKASSDRTAFEHFYADLPGKIRQLLKHMDPRVKSQRNIEKELSSFSEEARVELQKLLKYQQSFALNHKFKKGHHQSKYKGKAKNLNHLINKKKAVQYDKRKT